MPEENKSIFTSKTFWANVVGLVAMVVQGITGTEVVGIELQAGLLALINIVLRSITKSPVSWN